MTPTRASSKLAPCRRLPRAHGLDRAVWCSNLPASFATFFWAVLRPRIGGSRLRRAALAFLLVDETFGFAVAAGDSADRDGRPGDHSGRADALRLGRGLLPRLAGGHTDRRAGSGTPRHRGRDQRDLPRALHRAGLSCVQNPLPRPPRTGCRRSDGRVAVRAAQPARAARRRWRGRCASGRGDG
jgi:hypothetical protein